VKFGWLRAVLPVASVALIAPVCAEYLVGYDDTIGDPVALIFGLFVFVPVYGAPAVLIREVVRRRGHGWPSVLVLATAFGVVQAGLLDQSLFNPHYRGISYWDHLWQPTLLPGGWTSAAMILGFVGGHVVGSISAPIAVAEASFPARASERWLGPAGLAAVAALWAVGAAVILTDTLGHESFRPTVAQIAVTLAVAAVLVVAAFVVPSTPRKRTDARTPSAAVVFVVSAVALGVRPLLDSLEVSNRAAGGWLPSLAGLAVLTAFGIVLTHWSTRPGWDARHRLAVASGALIAIGAVAFSVHPIGQVPPVAKYATNSVLLLLLIAVLATAARRQRRHPTAEEIQQPAKR
jgi:hypothetical protein